MGYFSELAIDDTCRKDHSYSSLEQHLRWRIEDLQDRLDEISVGKHNAFARRYTDCLTIRKEITYILPECFIREANVQEAMELAKRELATLITDESDIFKISKSKKKTRLIPGQLTLWDLNLNITETRILSGIGMQEAA